MRRNDGGAAFPDDDHGRPGMSLRDYFAAKAIPAAIALWQEATNDQRKVWSGCMDSGLLFQRDYPRFIANVSGWIADAMLEARER